jgi:hypothetical protein
MMTKAAIREALGFSTDAELADFFGITAGAVSQWSENLPIPRARQWQAHALRPGTFGPTPDNQTRVS